MKFQVVEKFVSVNGEGQGAGQLAVFIRFAGCNLCCSYCDTKWANEKDVSYQSMTAEEIYEYIQSTGIYRVTLTGGEPLLQSEISSLLTVLSQDSKIFIEIETNGSIPLEKFVSLPRKQIAFTMDYKLPSSGMEQKMNVSNFSYLTTQDTVKFVVGSQKDLKTAKSIIETYDLVSKTAVYLSPVFGQISMEDIVDFMKQYKMNHVTLQVQLHKVIWNPEMRGV